MKNWEEQGDIRIHTFKYGGILKTEFYYRLNDEWPRDSFAMIGIDLTSLKVFFRCSLCLSDLRWARVLKDRPSRAEFCRGAAFRLYDREVNYIRRALSFPERRTE